MLPLTHPPSAHPPIHLSENAVGGVRPDHVRDSREMQSFCAAENSHEPNMQLKIDNFLLATLKPGEMNFIFYLTQCVERFLFPHEFNMSPK